MRERLMLVARLLRHSARSSASRRFSSGDGDGDPPHRRLRGGEGSVTAGKQNAGCDTHQGLMVMG